MAYQKTFDPNSSTPHKLSRTKLDLFIECPRCFYLDQRLGIKRPSMPAFTLNVAVDHLLKKEFDISRSQGKAHPLMETYKIKAIPIDHKNLADWRNNFVGVRYLHPETNFLIYGAIDDLWQDENGDYVVVDYKATSTQAEIKLEGGYKEVYKRQAEIYQWLLEKNGLPVSKKAYFVYVNGKKDLAAFDGRLEFDTQIIEYIGDNSWVDEAINNAHQCLISDTIPKPNDKCEYCCYLESAKKVID